MASKTNEGVVLEEESAIVDRGSGAPGPRYDDDQEFEELDAASEYARAIKRAAAATLRSDGVLERKDSQRKQYIVSAPGAAIERWRLSGSEQWAGTGQKTGTKAASANISFGEAEDLDEIAIGARVRVTYEQVGNTNSLVNVRVRPL